MEGKFRILLSRYEISRELMTSGVPRMTTIRLSRDIFSKEFSQGILNGMSRRDETVRREAVERGQQSSLAIIPLYKADQYEEINTKFEVTEKMLAGEVPLEVWLKRNSRVIPVQLKPVQPNTRRELDLQEERMIGKNCEKGVEGRIPKPRQHFLNSCRLSRDVEEWIGYREAEPPYIR